MTSRKTVFFIVAILLLITGCAKKTITPSPVISNLGDTYTLKAEKLARDARYVTANYYLKKAIPILKKSGHWIKMVRCYIQLGDNYRETANYKKALDTLNLALKLTLNHLGHKPLALAKSFRKLGNKYFRQGKDYANAMEAYQKALTIVVEVLGEDHPEVAKIYNSMALICWNKGDSQKALSYYNKSFSIKLTGLIERNRILAADYRFLTRELVKADTFSDTRQSFQESLALNLERYGQNHPMVAGIYENIGILYVIEGKYDAAMESLGKALAIHLNTYGNNHLKTASSYHNIGICLRLREDYGQAIRFLEDALDVKLARLGKYHSETADTFFQLGQVYVKLYEIDKALGFFQDALIAMVPNFSGTDFYINPDVPERHPAKDKLLKVVAAKAQALKLRYKYYPSGSEDLRRSLDTYLLASQLIDLIRKDYKSESYKLFFAGQCTELYGQGLQTALDLLELTGEERFKRTAFLFSEKSKASVLSEAVNEAHAKRFANIPDYLLAKERKLKSELALYDIYLQKETTAPGGIDKKMPAGIEDHYFRLKDEYQKLIAYFEANYQDYFALKYRPRPVSIDRLRQSLGPDKALVEYFLGNGVLRVFVLTDADLIVKSVQLPPAFDDMLENFYNSVKKIEERKFCDVSYRLYRVLFRPLLPHLANKRQIILIPHGKLYYVPFEALPCSPPQGPDFSRVDYLVRHFAFSYHYSAELWLHNRPRLTENSGTSFAGFAPVFSKIPPTGYILTARNTAVAPGSDGYADSYRDSATTDINAYYPELPASEYELRSIIQLFKENGKKAVGYFRDRAAEEVFKSPTMKNFEYIHIATHSLGKNRRLSGLLFSPPGDGTDAKEDGILYSSETYSLALDAELVVMSSCESGIGRLVKGEGMVALSRGFLYAGVRNIVFSLWRVEDRSTSRLMIEFYRNILAGQSLPEALRQAKLTLIANKFTAFPCYWSGFILVGK